ncbi:MAG TPA: hypothetical protein VFX97_11150 [Pyrinomonadaceae bacterium]|nr:hypothetical protein [Pyrinomonadaceae bacterium]
MKSTYLRAKGPGLRQSAKAAVGSKPEGYIPSYELLSVILVIGR